MEKIELKRVLQKIVDGDCLPCPSPVLIRLLELIVDERTSSNDLARVIEQDPSLTTRLLKVANSAFYFRSRTVSTISQAMLLIGFNRLRAIALGIALRDSFPMGRVGNMDYEYFWKTSLYRALIAQGFAGNSPVLRHLPKEEVFIAGLILEIGTLMLHSICPEGLKEAFPGGQVPLTEIIAWEQANLGMNHRQIGRIVLARWCFPEQILESQKHFGAGALREESSLLSKLLEYARSATEIFFGTRDDFEFIKEVAPLLGLDLDTVAEILATAFSRVEEIADQFRLQVDSRHDVQEVMGKARRSLMHMNAYLQVGLERIFGLISSIEQLELKDPQAATREARTALENELGAMVRGMRSPLLAIAGVAQRLARDVEGKTASGRCVSTVIDASSQLQAVLNAVEPIAHGSDPTAVQTDPLPPLRQAVDQLQALSVHIH
jgi:two-component system, cell cycle response regulator